MEFNCSSCNTTTNVDLKLEVSYFSCPKCYTLYVKKSNGEFTVKSKLKNEIYYHNFIIGQKASFSNVQYTIINIQIKKHYSTKWIEYTLQNEKGDFLYLSESGGNFILLEKIQFDENIEKYPETIEYNGNTFTKFDSFHPKLKIIYGYFDYNILNQFKLTEYINPPYLLSFENFKKEKKVFFGKHLSRKDVKKAFNTEEIPMKTEVGMVQPFFVNVRKMLITFCATALLILLSHWIITYDRTEIEVINKTLLFDEFKSNEFVSPSFELKGSSAPMQISVQTNVDNSWANVQVALVNENTNEEIYASKDIEYYHGYSEGESWREGSNSEDFNICGVSSGKYHFVISPIKATDDVKNRAILVKAIWNAPSLRNIFMTLIFMTILFLIVYFISSKFEDTRWGRE